MTKITVDKALIEQAIAAMPDRIGVSRFALRQKLRAALAEPAVEPVGHEQCKAIQESERNAAETNYFKARPQIDCIDRRNVFCAGFDRGFDAQKPAPVREPAPVQEQQPVAEVKVKMTGGNVGIATVIHEIYDPAREPLTPGQKLYTAQPRKAVKLSDSEILAALEVEYVSSAQNRHLFLSDARTIEAAVLKANGVEP